MARPRAANPDRGTAGIRTLLPDAAWIIAAILVADSAVSIVTPALGRDEDAWHATLLHLFSLACVAGPLILWRLAVVRSPVLQPAEAERVSREYIGRSRPTSRDRRRAALEATITAGTLLTVAAIGLLGVWVSAARMVREEFRGELERLALGAATLVDAELHQQLRDPSQTDSPEYRRAVEPLRRFRAALPDVRYLYTVIQEGNEVRFVLDAADPGDADGDGVEDRSEVWELYSECDENLRAALGAFGAAGRATSSDEPYTDRWGTFLSGYAPLIDSRGKQFGAIGVDIDAAVCLRQVAAAAARARRGTLPAGIVAIVLGAVVYLVRVRALASERHTVAARTSAENALRNLETYKAIIDTHAIVSETDLNGTITRVNDLFCKVSGYAREEVVGRNHGFLKSGRHPPSLWAEMWQTISAGGIWQGEVCSRSKSGSHFWVNATVAPMVDASGKIRGYFALRTDITPIKLAQERLSESESRFRELADAVPLMVWLSGADKKCTDFNRGWLEFRGRTLEQEIGDGWAEGVHPDDLPRCVETYTRAFDLRQPFQMVYRLRRHDGQYRWVEDRGVPRIASDGTFLGYAGGCMDVSDRILAEEQLQREQQFLRTVVDLIPGLVAVKSCDGRFLLANRALANAFGSTVDAIQGSRDIDLPAPPERIDELRRCELEALRDQAPRIIPELPLTYADGSVHWLKIVMVPLTEEQESCSRVLSVATDITESREFAAQLSAALAAAQAATVAKSEFLANMSHEIRTPMTAIMGFAELLGDRDSEPDDQQRLEYVATIKRNGEHLLAILNDILDLSKIEAGRMTVERIDTRPDQVIAEVVALMQVKATAQGLTLETEYDTPIPVFIRTDPVRLRQILVNLVGNAIKFTQVGGVTVRAGLGAVPSGEPALRIRIVDTGIGLSAEQVARLFQSFEQADASTTRRFGGTGLGLRISQRFAEMLGGTISVTSEVGVGSTFTVTVAAGVCNDVPMIDPRNKQIASRTPEPGSSAGPSAAPAGGERPLEGLRILLAEDGPDNQRLIAFQLRKAGAEVQVAANGRLAVEALTVDGTVDGPLADPPPFDLLLTDMQMPEMDGYSATRLLRMKGSELPILALTAHAMRADLEKCKAAGCDDYTSKPIDRKDLLRLCVEWGRGRRQRVS